MKTSLQTTNRLKLLLKHDLMDRRDNFFQGINSVAEKWQKCIDVLGHCVEQDAQLSQRPRCRVRYSLRQK